MSLLSNLLALFQTSTDTETSVTGDSNRATLNDVIFAIRAKWNGSTRASIEFQAGSDTTNKDDAEIVFKVSEGGVLSEAWRLKQNGNLKPASDKGIDFGTSVFDDYEEGTWTPNPDFTGGDNSAIFTSTYGHYTKIGRLVHISGTISIDKQTDTGALTIAGLPFTSSSDSFSARPGYVRVSRIGASGKLPGIFLPASSSIITTKLYDQGTGAENSITEAALAAAGNNTTLNFSLSYYI